VGGEDRTKNRSAAVPGRAHEKVIDRASVQNSKHLCLVERTLHRTALHLL
jgi:hypothetical protein